MPEPIFRRSTGELVKPSADDLSVDPEPDTLEPVDSDEGVDDAPSPEAPTPADDDDVVLELPEDPLANLYAPPEGYTAREEPPPAASLTVEIEPQPFISEQFVSEEIVVEKVQPKAKGNSGSALFIAGILLLLAVAAGFVVIVYYLFFAPRPDTSGF